MCNPSFMITILKGVLHGDIIMSNFYFTDATKQLSVFDWTETQQGSMLTDLYN